MPRMARRPPRGDGEAGESPALTRNGKPPPHGVRASPVDRLEPIMRFDLRGEGLALPWRADGASGVRPGPVAGFLIQQLAVSN